MSVTAFIHPRFQQAGLRFSFCSVPETNWEEQEENEQRVSILNHQYERGQRIILTSPPEGLAAQHIPGIVANARTQKNCITETTVERSGLERTLKIHLQ